MFATTSSPRGRFAPSPTGGLHLGSALVALVAWLSVRSKQGRFVWRIEDIDRPRVIPGVAAQQMDEARWLGLDWDEGPDVGGPFAPYAQSERGEHYEAAVERLAASSLLFPCTLSRKDLLAVASAPRGDEGLPPYLREFRPRKLAPGWFDQYRASRNPDAALRFRVEARKVGFEDGVMGHVEENVSEGVGDFVLKRRDGVYAYQLAVVVDDIEMQISEVVRGADLLHSTPRQIQLTGALGGNRPVYAHLPLVVNEAGEKLSKRNEAVSISEFRAAGIRPEAVVGRLARAVGLAEDLRAMAPRELLPHFRWDHIPRTPITIPTDIVEQLRRDVV